MDQLPLPRTRPVSGAWKNIPGRQPDYTVVDIDSLTGNYRISISRLYNQVKGDYKND